jgi:hypothetical protein
VKTPKLPCLLQVGRQSTDPGTVRHSRDVWQCDHLFQWHCGVHRTVCREHAASGKCALTLHRHTKRRCLIFPELRIEILTALGMKNAVFWDVILHILQLHYNLQRHIWRFSLFQAQSTVHSALYKQTVLLTLALNYFISNLNEFEVSAGYTLFWSPLLLFKSPRTLKVIVTKPILERVFGSFCKMCSL